jgi:MoxR-like ATPase
MEDEDFIRSIYKSKGISFPEKTTIEEKIMSINKDLSLFNNRKVSGLKENIQMTVFENKLTVLNVVTFNLVNIDEEVLESSFFATVDSKVDELKCELHFIVDESGTVFQTPSTEWMDNLSATFNIDVYPDEMAEVISKSIKSNKGLMGKKSTTSSPEYFDLSTNIHALMIEFEPSVSNTLKAHTELFSEIKKFKALSGSVNLEDFIDRYFFKKHILIQGEKGGGKTYGVHKMLMDKKVPFEEIDGHEGIEAIDLLGYYIKSDSGNLVWMDGVLTKAFRVALDRPVVLFIDEVLRIPSRELNILVGALAPMSNGTYTLRTNRIVNVKDGIGESEYLSIPVSNLWCVGTTNVGAGYQVDEIDDALADRFRIVNKSTTNSELESILNSYAISSSINLDIVPKMVEFYTQMRDLMISGELEKTVNTRHLCEALQLSNDASEVKMYMMDLIPTWTSSDTNGHPNKAEKDIITKMIKKIIK